MGIISRPPLSRIEKNLHYFTHFDAHVVNMQTNTKVNKWNIFIIIDDHKAQ